MRFAACLLTALVGGCSTPTATPQPATDAATSTPRPEATAPPVAGTAPATLGNAPRLATGVDPARDACKVDSDCQLIASCRCDSCIASKKMHVELCPEVCKVDACSGQRPVCVAGACASHRPPTDAPSAAVMEAASRAGQLLLDDPRFVAYLHAKERPERLPMVIAWEPGIPQPTWTVGGKPARIVEGLPPGPSLVPTMVLVEGDAATFRFTYAPEGIELSAQLAKKGDAWTIVAFTVTER